MTFEEAFCGAVASAPVEAAPVQARRRAKIMEVFTWPPSDRRERVIRRMERHAAAHLDLPIAQIDWSKIDWKKVLMAILKVLMALLPLLLL